MLMSSTSAPSASVPPHHMLPVDPSASAKAKGCRQRGTSVLVPSLSNGWEDGNPGSAHHPGGLEDGEGRFCVQPSPPRSPSAGAQVFVVSSSLPCSPVPAAAQPVTAPLWPPPGSAPSCHPRLPGLGRGPQWVAGECGAQEDQTEVGLGSRGRNPGRRGLCGPPCSPVSARLPAVTWRQARLRLRDAVQGPIL